MLAQEGRLPVPIPYVEGYTDEEDEHEARVLTTWDELAYEYRHGSCSTFAAALRNTLGYQVEAVFALALVEDAGFIPDPSCPDESLAHVYGVRPDGARVDVRGVFRLEDYLAECELGPVDGKTVWTQRISRRHLLALMDLCASKPAQGELRALRRHILRHQHLYGVAATPAAPGRAS